MTTIQSQFTAEAAQDAFGLRVARRLSGGALELPYEVSERLRAARVQAVSLRKRVQPQIAPQLVVSGSTAALGFEGQDMGFWGRLGSVLPILVLAFGLVFIHALQTERRASELAEVDAALLTDDLPPAAYADPGFLQFLKSAQGETAGLD